MKSLREQAEAYDPGTHVRIEETAFVEGARAALESVAAELMVYTLSGHDRNYATGYDKARVDASEIVHALIQSLEEKP